MTESSQHQRNAPRISLVDALAILDGSVGPVIPRDQDLPTALGYTLAADATLASDTGPAAALRLAGARLRRIDIALLAAQGVTHVSIRVPLILIVPAVAANTTVDTTCALIASAIEAEGGTAMIETTTADKSLDATLHREDADAVIAVGDINRNETSVHTLAGIGRVEFHGVDLTPGKATTFGLVGAMPVLLLPERMDAALAAWLVIGRRLLARLAFRLIEEQPFLLELARALISPLGMAEVVPVRRRAAQVEPLTGSPWTPQTIARADGWILVPADSTGHAAGTRVAVRPLP